MARPIQRKTKKKKVSKKEDTTETTINTNMGENQAVQTVKVVIQHPEKPKPRRRKKKDNKKDEAVKELKEELQSYDEVQNQAGEAGLEIPAELGVSPDEASNLKSTDDILKFIEIIREKKEAIKQLRPPPPQRPPNRFTEIMRPGIIPQVAQQFIPAQIQSQPFQPFQPQIPLPSPSPQIRPGIGEQLSDLERAEAEIPETLKLRKSESLEKFEKQEDRSFVEIKTILTNVDTARNANNGLLSQEQLNNFITQLEKAGNRYNTNFSVMSEKTQRIMEPTRQEFVDTLTKEIRKLRDELRTKFKSLPAPSSSPPAQPKETWKPVNAMGLPLLREYIRLDLNVVEITPSQANILATAIRGIPEITASEKLIQDLGEEPDANKRQNMIKETLQAIKKDEKLLRETTAQEARDQKKIAEMEKVDEELDAEKEAEKQLRDKLILYASSKGTEKGFVNWSEDIARSLKTLGMSRSEINKISTLSKGRDRKKVVGKFLGLGECKPGRRSGGACYLKPPPPIPLAKSNINEVVGQQKPLAGPGPVTGVPLRGRDGRPAPTQERGQLPTPTTAKPSTISPSTPTAKLPPGTRIIQARSTEEFTRLKQQYAGDSNVVVQAPQKPSGTITGKSIQDKIGIGTMFKTPDLTPGGQSDLSAGRLGGDARQVIQATTWNEYYKLFKLHGQNPGVIVKPPN